MLAVWVVVFFVSLIVLVKGADWLIASSEKIGLSFGLSPFIVGVTIVGLGTSFPELVSSIVAVMQGITDVPVANAIGSNIANILLVIGFSAIVGKRLVVTKSLIDLDLPLLAIGTSLFVVVAWDQQITFGESVLMIVTYGTYILYTIFHKEDQSEKEIKESTHESSTHAFVGGGAEEDKKDKKNVEQQSATKDGSTVSPVVTKKDYLLLVFGVIGLIFGAKFLIDALVYISEALNLSPGVIAVTAVAIGTSLPELLVSAKAAMQGKSEVAVGNIFGSNVFNIMMVTGVPGLFTQLDIDDQTFLIGLPIMALATLLFVISGISRRIHLWEGMFYLSLYVLFVAKLFMWF